MTADIGLGLDDDASLHDLAMIHHLLALKVTKRNGRPSTEPSEGSSSKNWLWNVRTRVWHGLLSEHAE